MPDYEDMILTRQEMIEIFEDDPDSALCPIGFAGGMIFQRRSLYVDLFR